MAEITYRTTSESQPDDYDLKIDRFCKIHECFADDPRQNKYHKYEQIRNRYGVYIFLDKLGYPLYVGEAVGQSLKKRITQNYKQKDTGATFLKNWCSHEKKAETHEKKAETHEKKAETKKKKAETKISDEIFARFKKAMEDEE